MKNLLSCIVVALILSACASDYVYKSEGDRLENSAHEKGFNSYKEYSKSLESNE
ncbi:MAG: hypothetical protein J1D99_04590 [Campylobacter sp.]|nr:hypothetical protein [Campylobacter sp.]